VAGDDIFCFDEGSQQRAREAAVVFAGEHQDEDAAVVLLRDIRDIFEGRGVDRLASKTIVDHLNGADDAMWPDWRGIHPDGLTPLKATTGIPLRSSAPTAAAPQPPPTSTMTGQLLWRTPTTMRATSDPSRVSLPGWRTSRAYQPPWRAATTVMSAPPWATSTPTVGASRRCELREAPPAEPELRRRGQSSHLIPVENSNLLEIESQSRPCTKGVAAARFFLRFLTALWW
jgi:hypothetical protein